MRAILCLVGEAIVRDADSNTASVFNILESITAEGFPVLVPRIAFMVLWEREPNEPETRQTHFRALLDGEQLFTRGLTIDFRGQPRNRTVNRVQGLVIPKPGNLRFQLAVENGPTAEYAITVNATAQAAAPHIDVGG